MRRSKSLRLGLLHKRLEVVFVERPLFSKANRVTDTKVSDKQQAIAVNQLCVIGHPSRLGGADTELDHQIRCWQAMGVEVHICHTGQLDDNLKSMELEKRGCIYHEPCDWKSLAGMHVISFCNGEYLKALPVIRQFECGID